MSELQLQASVSNVDESASSASYADDFHSDERRSSSRRSRRSSDSADVDEQSDPPAAAAVTYSYRDQRRSIRIYAPTIDIQLDDDAPDWDQLPATASARSAQQRRSTASYSSNFEAASRPASSSSTSDTHESESESGASHLRVVSIDELTTASTESLSLRAQEEALAAAEHAAIEAAAQALLARLRRDGRRSQRGSGSLASVHPSLLLIGASPETTIAPRLTVERLRVESLRLAGRLLIGCRTHEPSACIDCRAASERLARSDWLRALANRARGDTVAHRLKMHAPASVMSRQMLNVAQNARLVSDWMRTGRMPVMCGFT